MTEPRSNLFAFDFRDNTAVDPGYAVSANDLPYVDWMPGLKLKLLASNQEGAFFVVRILFAPGTQLPPHMHTGAVHAFTHAGKWTYLEYPAGHFCQAGSYLYEPAGSVHTLKVADDNVGETDVTFLVEGAMVHLDEEGRVMAIGDAGSHVKDYVAACRAQGHPVPEIILGGTSRISHPV